jgi:hypothetical protein
MALQPEWKYQHSQYLDVVWNHEQRGEPCVFLNGTIQTVFGFEDLFASNNIRARAEEPKSMYGFGREQKIH